MSPASEMSFDAGLAAPIVGLPLAGAVLLLLFGGRIRRWAGHVASAAIALAFAAAAVQFARLLEIEQHARSRVVTLFDWIEVGGLRAGADLLVDQLSMVMVLVVTGVGTLIHVYSIAYMHGEQRYHRYFAYLNLFAASMLLLVLADNLVLLYVGWEGVGLCSYLLIGFWFEKDAAADAAKKAFIVNRIGDFSFLVGILVLAATAGSISVGQINAQAGAMTAGVATVAALLLFGGATGKSAQIPLYVWLPDAMEGPTPVSALIHAATMVTAGVYVVARMSPVFEQSGGTALTVVALIGAITALWTAVIACAENDIKRVLAYSTISQLGYMFLAAGVGAYSVAIFHLVTHAFFKALMFLGAGAVMHAMHGETDMREMGGLRKHMPVVGLTFAAGWLAISGIIPFSGFFSKDAILAAAWEEGEYTLWAIGVATALLTAFYLTRLYVRVFEGPSRVPHGFHPHDASPAMAAALVPLAALSLVGGVINLPGALTLEHFFEPLFGEAHEPETATAFLLGAAALVAAAVGIALAWALYRAEGSEGRRAARDRVLGGLVPAARDKFYVDELYGRIVVAPGRRFAEFCAGVVDVRIVDGALTGLGAAVAGIAETARRLQTGYVRNYAAAILFGAVVVLGVLALRVS